MRLGRLGHELAQHHAAGRAVVVPARLAREQRVARGLAVRAGLHRGAQRPGAVAVVLGIEEALVPPVAPPVEHAGRAGAGPLEQGLDLLQRGGRLERARRRVGDRHVASQRHAVELQVVAHRPRGEAEAVAAVDRALGGPQDRRGLAELARVVEQRAHDRRQVPAPRVARDDADPGHAGDGQRPAGDGQLAGERAAGRDELAVRADPDHAPRVGEPLVQRDVLGVGDLVEGEMAGLLERVLVGGGQPLGSAHAAALRCRQTRNATSASTPATAAAGPAVEITCSAKWPRK